MAKRQSKRDFVLDQINDQVNWINRCGGNLDGYIARYGNADDPDKCGNGGPAIYDADMKALAHWIRQGIKLGIFSNTVLG